VGGGNLSTVLIDHFLGIHLDATGDTNLKVGELSECKNIRITENYKPRKREGYEELFASIASKNIQGMWYGKLSNTYHFVFACNGHVYEQNMTTNVNTDLGTLTDAKTFFFAFNDNLYIMNGSSYKKWAGTGSIEDVAGYRPKVAIGTPPAGGGTLYEEINMLTGEKHQTFNADGTATAYFIAEANVASIDFVKVNGVTKTLTTDYTVNLTTGTITFTSAPATGQDNVDIGWAKGSGQRSKVYKNKKALIFGGASDTRVHIWGNLDDKNTIYFSALADGLPSAEYFPEFNNNKVGSSQFAVTDMIRQYDRAIIYTENDTWFTYYDAITDVNDNVIASFPVFALNQERGNVAFGQSQLIQNNPFSIYNGVYEWVATNVRDERNAVLKSQRVQLALDELDLTNAITFDYVKAAEYWLAVGKIIYIYNYRLDVWYKFELYNTPTCFIEIDNELYFGTTTGQIMKFGEYGLMTDDNGEIIHSKLETGFLDFGENNKRKFINFGWVGLQPETKSICFVEWQTDYSTSSDPDIISYNLANFTNVDFGDFSFETISIPHPFRLKLKAKKFTYFKLIISNDSLTDSMTILNINLPALSGGMSK
jgi:hypothetical protein